MTPKRHEREWLSVSAYARKYGIARVTVYKFIRTDNVEHWQIGRVLRIKDRPPRAQNCS